MPPKTQREREAEQRELKLERIKEQVDDGSLVIRKMTDCLLYTSDAADE